MTKLARNWRLLAAGLLLIPAVLLVLHAVNQRMTLRSDRMKLIAAVSQTDQLRGELSALESSLERAERERGSGGLSTAGRGDAYLRHFESIIQALEMRESPAPGSDLKERFAMQRDSCERLVQDLNFLTVQTQSGSEEDRGPGAGESGGAAVGVGGVLSMTRDLRSRLGKLHGALVKELNRVERTTNRMVMLSLALAGLSMVAAAFLLGAHFTGSAES